MWSSTVFLALLGFDSWGCRFGRVLGSIWGQAALLVVLAVLASVVVLALVFSVFPDESGLRMFRGVQFQFRDHASLDGGVAVCGSVSPRVVCSCFCVLCGL